MPTPRHRTCGPERPRGPVTNFLALSPRRRGSASEALAAHFAAPVRMHARTRAHDGRPTTNDATCGPPAWLAGRLHDGEIRSVRSPLRRASLSGTPITTPLQGGRPKRSGLLFLKLLQGHWRKAPCVPTCPFGVISPLVPCHGLCRIIAPWPCGGRRHVRPTATARVCRVGGVNIIPRFYIRAGSGAPRPQVSNRTAQHADTATAKRIVHAWLGQDRVRASEPSKRAKRHGRHTNKFNLRDGGNAAA